LQRIQQEFEQFLESEGVDLTATAAH
jgi:hypothetical protein